MSLPALGPLALALAQPVPSATLADGSTIALVTIPPPVPIRADLVAKILPPQEQVTVFAAKPPHAKGDPLEAFNRAMFEAHQKFDRAVLRPVAMGYKQAVPKPVRSGLRTRMSRCNRPSSVSSPGSRKRSSNW